MKNKLSKEQLEKALINCGRKMDNTNSVRFLILEWVKLKNKNK
jgi:hypothetical protein